MKTVSILQLLITSQFLERHEVLHRNTMCWKGSTALAHTDEASWSPTWYLKFQQQRWLLFSYTFHILMAELQYIGARLAKILKGKMLRASCLNLAKGDQTCTER